MQPRGHPRTKLAQRLLLIRLGLQHIIQLIHSRPVILPHTQRLIIPRGQLAGLLPIIQVDQQVNQQRQHIQRRKVQRHHIVRRIQQRIVRIIQQHGTLQGAVVQYGILVVGILFLISLDFLLIVALH